MPSLLAGFTALLAIWLVHIHGSLAQDDSNPNNVTLCGESDFYNSTTTPYSFNNNKWGDDGSGFSCLNVLDQGTSFSVTFQWTGDASTVKGFPYLKLDPSKLPTQLWNISTLQFSGSWSTTVQGPYDQSATEQTQAYDDIGLKTNAAIDMFLSDNPTNSTGLGPPIEIMIWLWYVPAILPLGHSESTPEIDTVEVAGTNFSLYHGWNAQGQNVFSWLAHKNLTETDADYSPLLQYIWKEKELLSGALYLGQLEFGTEVMHAGLTTMFEASGYELALYREGDEDDPNPKTTSSTASASATGTATRTGTANASVATGVTASSASSSGAGPVTGMGFSSYQKLCMALPFVVSMVPGAWMLMVAL